MEDSKQGFRVEFGQEQQKGRVQLKVAAWALCKESNVASGENSIASEKELKSEENRKENNVVSGKLQNVASSLYAITSEMKLKKKIPETVKEVQKIPYHCSVLGVERKRLFRSEGLLRKKFKAEKELKNHVGEVATPRAKNKSVPDFLNLKKEVEFGKEKKEIKCYEEDNGEEVEEFEDDNDEMDTQMADNDMVNAQYVQNVIAGRENIGFLRFKSLMEGGHLKKEDLFLMKNARVVQVPGKGEVVQFLVSSKKEFNKINLKELKLNDVMAVRPFTKKQMRIFAHTQLSGFISGLISKRGSTFRCNTCHTVHADAASVKSHINIKHGDMLVKSGAYEHSRCNDKIIGRAISQLLKKICDPSLLIEQVVITSNMWKQVRKRDSVENHQINVYQRAADLLAALIQPGRAPGPGKGHMAKG